MKKNERNTFNLLFYIKRTKVLKNGGVPIYARITINKKRAEISLNRSIKPSLWDNKKCIVKGNTFESNEINELIRTIENKVFNLHREMIYNGAHISARALANEYSGKTIKETTLLDMFQEHNEKMVEAIGTEYKKNTFKKYRTAYNHLKNYLSNYTVDQDIPIKHIDLKFINDFDYYLCVKMKLKPSSLNTTIAALKKVTRIAQANKVILSDPFIGYKTKKVTTHRRYLSPAELAIIENGELKEERLIKVKDIFIFCCYTGLSHCDVKALTKDNLEINIGGQKSICGKRQKTNVEYIVPLLKPALDILEKYQNDSIDDKLLPVISNQKMNDYLKEITSILKMDKNVTCHMARHTFATAVVLNNGVSMETLKTMMAHTDIKTTQHYGKIMNDKVFQDMNSVDKQINKRKVRYL